MIVELSIGGIEEVEEMIVELSIGGIEVEGGCWEVE